MAAPGQQFADWNAIPVDESRKGMLGKLLAFGLASFQDKKTPGVAPPASTNTGVGVPPLQSPNYSLMPNPRPEGLYVGKPKPVMQTMQPAPVQNPQDLDGDGQIDNFWGKK